MAEDPGSPGGRRRARRGSFGPTLAAGLAGAALATVAATQSWAEATTRAPALRTETAEGTDAAPLVLPLALVALAAWGTVLVLRRRGRRVVAVLGVLASLGAGVLALLLAHTAPEVARELLGDPAEASTSATAWPFVAAAGALVSATAFAVALVRAPTWPEMSSRYDAPGDGPRKDRDGRAPGAEMSDTELWKALDEGHDPTA